jgi:RNA polymerase sigma-70 factor (ECF subfamily)
MEATTGDALEHVASAQTGNGSAECVSVTLSALPEHYRDVICAKYRDGMSVIEIASVRGQHPKAIESLLTRAREAFRREYRRLQEET